MHWIDPDCFLETQGAVEGFIIDRHGGIDGVLLTGPRQTLLLVCTPPPMGAEIEAAKLPCLGSPIAVRGTGLQIKHGRVIAADEVGSDRRSLKRVKAQKHKDERSTRSAATTNQRLPAYRARSRPT